MSGDEFEKLRDRTRGRQVGAPRSREELVADLRSALSQPAMDEFVLSVERGEDEEATKVLAYENYTADQIKILIDHTRGYLKAMDEECPRLVNAYQAAELLWTKRKGFPKPEYLRLVKDVPAPVGRSPRDGVVWRQRDLAQWWSTKKMFEGAVVPVDPRGD